LPRHRELAKIPEAAISLTATLLKIRIPGGEPTVSAMVTIVDDNSELRELLEILLKSEMGVPCLGLASLSEVQAQAPEVLRTQIALLDINLGPFDPDGISVCEWLRENDYRGQIFFLTGHAADSPRLQRAIATGVRVLEKPLTADEFLSVLRQAIPAQGADMENAPAELPQSP